MSLQMTQAEREAFLADLHVGVIAIARVDGPPLAVPIWYSYEPGGEVTILTGADSLKGRLLASAERFSLCAQVEAPPFYAYVSVEGPVSSVGPADREADTRPMAHRYFGEEMGDLYVEGTEGDSTKFTMRPERWWTVDYAKMG
jgi:nitroimidazol reductase NimA-like FMN-containing flavoprotein (pyridoxamine 5'-phosphate oxidase superfamily)